jgi:hypothetical protein
MPNIKKRRYLVVEAPDTEACVDFLSEGVCVKITIHNRKLIATFQAFRAEGDSTWEEQDFLMSLPEREETVPEEKEEEED